MSNLAINDAPIAAQNPVSVLSHWVNRIVVVVTIAMMAVMIADVFLQVLYRYVLNDSLAWSDEFGRYLFFWIIFLGASIGVKENKNPSFGSVVHALPGKARNTVILVARCAILGYLTLVFLMTLRVLPTVSLSLAAALRIPMSYIYYIFIIFAVVSAIHILSFIFEDWRGVPIVGWVLGALVLAAIIYIGSVGPMQHMHLNFPLVLVISLLLFFALGIPIAFVLGLVSVALVYFSTSIPMDILPQRMYLVAENFSLMAIPFFMFTGALMQVGGVAERLVRLATALLGWVRGGLGYVDILISAFFADISGSAVADTAAIGSVMLPGMIERGYEKPFATALQSANGTLGVMIPPSITTILFAITANVSVVQMFLSSFLPAFLVMISFAIVNFIVAKKRNYPRLPRPAASEVWVAFKRGFFPLWTPIIILGGILSGIFTPTEAGVIAVFYTLIMLFFQRELKWKTLYLAFIEGIHGTSRVMLIVASAFVLGWLLIVSQLSQTIATGMFSLSHNKIIILIIVNVFLAMVHIILESSSTILLIVPILMPLLSNIGIDPIHFGILLLINSCIGLLTPPVGVILYIASGITNIKVETLAKAVIPFMFALVVDLLIVIIFPGFVSFVPHLLGHG